MVAKKNLRNLKNIKVNNNSKKIQKLNINKSFLNKLIIAVIFIILCLSIFFVVKLITQKEAGLSPEEGAIFPNNPHLNLPSPYSKTDPTNQTIHPSVLYFPDTWSSYKYWMCMTPYPGNNAAYENPSLLACNDNCESSNAVWVVPNGIVNPINKTGSVNSSSDCDIVYNDNTNELYIYYRKTNLSDNSLYLQKMNEEYDLTVETFIKKIKEGSSSIIKQGNTWYKWATVGAQPYHTSYETSSDGITWSDPVNITFSPNPPYQNTSWHLDVTYIPSKNEYWMIYNTYGNSPYQLFLAKSTNRIDWTWYNTAIIKPRQGEWDSNLYRSSFIYDSITDIIHLWYSGRNVSANTENYIGYTEQTYTNLMNALAIDTSINDISISIPSINYTQPDYSPFALTEFRPTDNLALYEQAGVNFIRSGANSYSSNITDRNGFHRIGSISGDPDLIGDEVRYPADFTTFNNTLTTKINTKKDFITYWKVGNEADNEWDGINSFFVAEFVHLQNDSYTAIKSLFPSAVIFESGFGVVWNYNGIDEFFNNSGNLYMDGLDIHLYTDLVDGNWTIPKRDGGYCANPVICDSPTISLGRMNVFDYLSHVNDLCTINNFTGPIWSTEFGLYVNKTIYNTSSPYQKREEIRQAEDLVKKYIMALSTGLKRIFLVEMSDAIKLTCETNPNYFCHSLTNSNHKKRISFTAYKTMNEFLNDTNYITFTYQKTPNGNNLNIYSFYKPRNLILSIWLDDKYSMSIYPNATINLSVNTSEYNITFNEFKIINSLTGNNISFTYDYSNNLLNITNLFVNQTPLYVILANSSITCGDRVCSPTENTTNCAKDCGYSNTLLNNLTLYLAFDPGYLFNHTDYSSHRGDTYFDSGSIGSPSLSTGKIGTTSLVFDGKTSLAAGKYAVDYGEINNEYTLALWVKLNPNINLSKKYYITSAGWSYALLYDNQRWAYLTIMENNTGNLLAKSVYTPQQKITTNTWYFLTLTYNGTDLLLYVNGTKYGNTSTGNFSQQTTIALPNLYLGGTSTTLDYFNGTIDEVRIYNRDLNISEINQLYSLTTVLCPFDYDGDGYSTLGGECGTIDCNDDNATINTGVNEVCGDNVDNNCNEQIDECCTTPCGENPPGPSGPSGPSGTPSGCTPDCIGKQCGNDSCGGVCGTCIEGYTCTTEGSCEIIQQLPNPDQNININETEPNQESKVKSFTLFIIILGILLVLIIVVIFLIRKYFDFPHQIIKK